MTEKIIKLHDQASSETIKEAAARIFAGSRAAQGMPPQVEDSRVILRAMRSVPPVKTYPVQDAEVA